MFQAYTIFFSFLLSYFRIALEMRPNCPAMMARAAHGLLRIKNRKLLDLNFIKELLDKVEKLTPNNPMVYHDLGLYYDKYKNVST